MKLVMYAQGSESLKMIGCRNARYVSASTKEAVIPMICHLGTRCQCVKEKEPPLSDTIKSRQKRFLHKRI